MSFLQPLRMECLFIVMFDMKKFRMLVNFGKKDIEVQIRICIVICSATGCDGPYSNKYSGGCAVGGCSPQTSLQEAQKKCLELSSCNAVTKTCRGYELRASNKLSNSPSGEITWICYSKTGKSFIELPSPMMENASCCNETDSF